MSIEGSILKNFKDGMIRVRNLGQIGNVIKPLYLIKLDEGFWVLDDFNKEMKVELEKIYISLIFYMLLEGVNATIIEDV